MKEKSTQHFPVTPVVPEAGDAAIDAGSPLDEAVDRARDMLVTVVREDPYRAVAVAVGIGILVGGGMWRQLARAAVALGTRLAVNEVVSSLSRDPQTRNRQE